MNKVKIPVKFYVSCMHFDKHAKPGSEILDWNIEVDERACLDKDLLTSLAIAKQNELLEIYSRKGGGYALIVSKKSYEKIKFVTDLVYDAFSNSKKQLEKLTKDINWDTEMIKTTNEKLTRVNKSEYIAFQILKVLEK